MKSYIPSQDIRIIFIPFVICKYLLRLYPHQDLNSSLFSGNEMVSGGEDGIVNIWDTRVKNVINRIEPYKNDKIARPDLGKWIGAVSFNDDWLVR